jgi:hypothetical protein
MKKRQMYIIGTIALLVIALIISYPLYARKTCSDIADKYSGYMKAGEPYLSIDKPLNDGTDGITRTIIKQSEFNRVCLQSKFGL